MFVGVGVVQLGLHGAMSLKEKRRIVKSVIQRTKNKFNVAISEVDDLDTMTRATLGYSCVGNESAFVNRCMQKISDFIDELELAEVMYDNFELVQW